jgi:hypothetical protein
MESEIAKLVDEFEEGKLSRRGLIQGLTAIAATGIVDHYAIAIRGFNQSQVTAALAEHGLQSEQNLDYGFYVRDPAGIPVQIVGAQ